MTIFLRSGIIAIGVTLAHAAVAGTLTPLYNFTGGLDGANPFGNIAVDQAGNIFGVTYTGGANNNGTLFELSPPAGGTGPWAETILWSFDSAKGGAAPTGLVQDKHGNLFGTLRTGGTGCGSMFELGKTASGWKRRIIWHFSNSGDACEPFQPPVIGADGVLYGTTLVGGKAGEGAIYSLTPPPKGSQTWSEAVIYSLKYSDGEHPASQPIVDAAGNLYGEGSDGGKNGGGTVWKLAPPQAGSTVWTFSDLWSSAVSCSLYGMLTFAPAGALYGVCPAPYGPNEPGSVFELTPPAGGQTDWTQQTLFAFKGAGVGPVPALIPDGKGNLYGVTQYYPGSLFELTPPASGQTAWTKHTLWRFTGGADGNEPSLPIVLSAGRTITGTSYSGGATGDGVVWRWTP